MMLTLTGNKKTAKEARRTAAKAVSRATRTLSRQTRKQTNRPRGLLIALLAALIGAGAVLAWRTMMPSAEPDPVKKADGPVQPPVPPVP
ncbi:hypothetical protein ACIPYV_07760 [Paenarthrobacter nicotinovorans]|uniref:hypothetical protein n=1 Tax=Paenarthrobacter nicotinovorans TaxID=29320 RepID=UPI00382D8F35